MIATPVSKYPGHEDNIVWWAPVNPCMHPYVPVSFAIRKIPKHFQSYPLKEALERQRQTEPNLFENNPKHFFTLIERHRDHVDESYGERIGEAKRQAAKLEKKLHCIRKRKKPAKGSYKLLKKYYKFYRKIVRKLPR
ncbi:MAG: hypothetical protein GXO24_06810 [Chlorobi bacterium]|nr:hypothetical protein [Chlorobiota bacterium]